MPIDREDGRHWCAPDRETPNGDGIWVCTGCDQSWSLLPVNVWVRTDEVPAYLAGIAVALAPTDLAEEEI